MELSLNIYTDDTLCELKRVAKADKLQIPYKVSLYLIQSLDRVNFDDSTELVKFITSNVDKLDKIVKATFKVSETELECVDGAELISMIKELYTWAIDKVNGLKGNEKNSLTPVMRD